MLVIILMDLNIFRIYFITILQLFPSFVDLQGNEIRSNGVYMVLVSHEIAKSGYKKDAGKLETDEAFYSCSMEQKCRYIIDRRISGKQIEASEDIEFSSIDIADDTWMRINPGLGQILQKNREPVTENENDGQDEEPGIEIDIDDTIKFPEY